MKTPVQCVKPVQSYKDIRQHSGVYNVNFEQILHILLVFLLFLLTK